MKGRILLVSLALMTSQVAFAEEKEGEPKIPELHKLSMNVGIASQYVYRGLTQTNSTPAIQGGIDYKYNNSFYIGTWFSNTSFYNDLLLGASSSLEVDGYVGYKGTIGNGWRYDVGALRYEFPGTHPQTALNAARLVRPNSTELYASIGYKWVNVKYSYAVGSLFGIPNTGGSYYLEGEGDIPILDTGFELALHAGRQVFRGTSPEGISNNSLFSYADYRIGIQKDIASYTLSIAVTKSTAQAAGYTNLFGTNTGANHFIASVYKEF